MVDLRELRRAESRKRRVLEKLGDDQRETIRHIRIGKALEQMRAIVSDETFSKFIYTRGIQSIPRLLTQEHNSEVQPLDRSLDFVIAWRFFSPFIYDAVTSAFIDKRWPGFSLELRDIFISIVADGPFPFEPRGRDRRTL